MTQKILCGNANKFYRCVTCDAPCGSEGHYVEVTEEPKQETLEEAAKRYIDSHHMLDSNSYNGFIEGAKWQAEKLTIENQALRSVISELQKTLYSGKDMYKYALYVLSSKTVLTPDEWRERHHREGYIVNCVGNTEGCFMNSPAFDCGCVKLKKITQ